MWQVTSLSYNIRKPAWATLLFNIYRLSTWRETRTVSSPLWLEEGLPYNPCGFVTDRRIDWLSDSKVSYFATLILRKVKEIGLIATTRFEHLDLNCVIGWFKNFGIALWRHYVAHMWALRARDSRESRARAARAAPTCGQVIMTSSKAWGKKCVFLQKRHFFEPKFHHEGMK